jgi:uncharacterized integral membrane protein
MRLGPFSFLKNTVQNPLKVAIITSMIRGSVIVMESGSVDPVDLQGTDSYHEAQ